jgi:hypothetical protein
VKTFPEECDRTKEKSRCRARSRSGKTIADEKRAARGRRVAGRGFFFVSPMKSLTRAVEIDIAAHTFLFDCAREYLSRERG